MDLAKCPQCGTEINKASKEWNYHVFHVKAFFCQKCKTKFQAYYRKNGVFSHTIPKAKHTSK